MFQKDSGQQAKQENEYCLAEWLLQNTTSANQSVVHVSNASEIVFMNM
jgi:hypothetical protein